MSDDYEQKTATAIPVLLAALERISELTAEAAELEAAAKRYGTIHAEIRELRKSFNEDVRYVQMERSETFLLFYQLVQERLKMKHVCTVPEVSREP